MSQDSSPGLCRIGCLLLALSGLMTPPTVEAIAQQTTPPEQAQPASVGEAEDPESVGAALKGGQGRVKLRYRYESVSQDPFELNAAASTLRTALSYQRFRSRASTFSWKPRTSPRSVTTFTTTAAPAASPTAPSTGRWSPIRR